MWLVCVKILLISIFNLKEILFFYILDWFKDASKGCLWRDYNTKLCTRLLRSHKWSCYVQLKWSSTYRCDKTLYSHQRKKNILNLWHYTLIYNNILIQINFLWRSVIFQSIPWHKKMHTHDCRNLTFSTFFTLFFLFLFVF